MAAIVSLLTQERSTFDGQYVQLRDAFCEPKPVQRPHPPITIGGKGPKRTLRAVARWAQGWNAITQTPQEYAALKEILAAHCADFGRDVKEITCSVNVRLPEDGDYTEAIEQAKAYGGAGADLIVLNLPLDCLPDVLRPVADAFAPLA